VLLADREFHATIAPALALLGSKRPIVIDIADAETEGAPNFGEVEYEDFIASGDAAFAYAGPEDEWDSICLLYTSGTTGNPKGVVYSHRGAYLAALGNALTFKLDHESRYLWTLPMFHCSGWTFTWGVTATGGTHVCLRRVEPRRIFDAIVAHRITHICGSPIVLNMLVHAPTAAKHPLPVRTKVATGGAAPPAIVIQRMEAMGFEGPAPLRHHRKLRALHLLRADVRMAGAAGGRPLRADGAAGHRQRAHRAPDGRRPAHPATRAQGRGHHGRDHGDRQHADEGLSQERGRDR
jgi:acyl-CoA synthetase (AMP-forming)/AMP-acid ligase II